MANVLNIDKKIAVIGALAEGSSIRSIERITGVHRDTIMRLGVPVKEVFQGKTIWDGVVEVFDLTGHPKTNRVYAWAHATDDPNHPWRHVTVLHIPPAISPQTAVQAAIMQEIQSHARPQA
jgi:hypothetical protein